MKDNIDFFTHDSNAGVHPKMKALLATYGFEGYGRFWRLNELISTAPHCKLDISRRIFFANVADELRTSPDELEKFIDFLTDPEECGLIQVVDNMLITDRTQSDLVYAIKARQDAKRRRDRASGDDGQTSADESKTSADADHDRQTEQTDRTDRQTEGVVDLRSWLQEYAEHSSTVRNPGGFVRSVLADPGSPKWAELMAQYERAKSEASRPAPEPKPPAPERCDTCGATDIFAGGQDGEAVCRRCGRFFLLRNGEWIPDPETGQPEDDFPDPVDDFEEAQG